MAENEAREEKNKLEGAAGEAAPPVLELPAAVADAIARIPELERADLLGQAVVVVAADQWAPLAESLKAAGFESLVDICAVDYLDYPAGAIRPGHRFEVVANLLSYSLNARLRVRIPLDGDDPTCPSVTGVWPSADWFEREAYDMFGITFDGHPDLCRILMPDDWVGHPLRKDFEVGAIPVQFAESPKPL